MYENAQIECHIITRRIRYDLLPRVVAVEHADMSDAIADHVLRGGVVRVRNTRDRQGHAVTLVALYATTSQDGEREGESVIGCHLWTHPVVERASCCCDCDHGTATD